MRFRSMVRGLLPAAVVAVYHRYLESKRNHINRRLSTEEVFTDIYSNNRWGGSSGTFFSGSGSHDATVVSPYIAALTRELDRLGGAAMTLVDLGCGDFSVGRQLAASCGRYVGVDIVKPLVDHNRATYGSSAISFLHANIVEDDMPPGDICLIRQVFQHLSNDQIMAALPKLDKYRWCFITEHQPSPSRLRLPNLDKPHGGNIRASQGSGVFLDQAPFNVPKDRYRLLLEVPGTSLPGGMDPGVIRTFVLEGNPVGPNSAT
jgi:hypothetical protein